MKAMKIWLERAAKERELVFHERRAASKKHRVLGDLTEPLRTLWAALAFVVLVVASAGAPAMGEGLQSLEITTSTGRHTFQVEIANNDASRERGLMDRRYMAADHGMLFEFDRDAPVSFWMKNTYIPLDMIFIAGSGVVTRTRRQRRAAVRARHTIGRSLRGGARIEWRNGGFDRPQGRRQGSPSVLQAVTWRWAAWR